MSWAGSGRPSTEIWPPSGATSPTSSRSTVDLPQPDGPSSAVVFPDANVRSMPSTAAPAPYRLITFESRSSIYIFLNSLAPRSGERVGVRGRRWHGPPHPAPSGSRPLPQGGEARESAPSPQPSLVVAFARFVAFAFEGAVQRASIDPELLGGALLVAAALLQHQLDVTPFQLRQAGPVGDDAAAVGAARRRDRRRRSRAAAHLGRQVRRQHDVALRDGDRALDRILQLAHVAGPAVGV